jgi:E3 ubiquitin-protein ligase TRIP12
MAAGKYGEVLVLQYFETLGALTSRAISDDRLTDLPFSSVFWDICIGNPITFSHISKLDTAFGRSVNELREYSLKRNEILKKDIDKQIRERQLATCKLKNDATIDDLCLYFVIPGSNVILKPQGKDIQVTDDNLTEYLDLLLDVMLDKSIEKQVAAFKKGFHKNMEYLKVLKPEEIELIICGNNDDDKEWTKQNLKEHIIPNHGYHDSSQTYLDLINYMVALTPENRRQFLAFSTGSPRLPLGGFKNLKPKMSVVRKNEGSDNPNLFLPSVMTCQNFLKIPEYSSLMILTERFNTAVVEGQESFTLS